MSFVKTVCLVNRTKQVLNCTYDGHQYELQPGENHGFPEIAVPYAKRQNPLMGSEDPYNPSKFVSLVGVKGTKDDISPIKQSNAVERLDRSKVKGIGRKARPEEGDPVGPLEARVAGNEADIDGEAVGAR